MSDKRRGDEGAAMIEFIVLAVAIAVPLAYLLLAVFDVQRTAYAASSATREAARVFVRAPSGPEAEARARAAAEISLADHGLTLTDGSFSISCSASPCLTPGGTVRVAFSTQVTLPLVPVVGSHALASVPVRAANTETVDIYSPIRP